MSAVDRATRLLSGGSEAFPAILRRINAAERSLHMRVFDWRDDATGGELARAVLAAADRGVRVTIEKDLIGASYELGEGSKQSMLHKDADVVTRLQAAFLRTMYRNGSAGTPLASALTEALIAHPNIRIDRLRRRFDHSKVYVIDGEILILGGMGIGDDFQHDNIDFMIELCGRDLVERFYDRCAGRVDHDAGRDIDFLVHTVAVHDAAASPLVRERLALIDGARRRLMIEMAYLGDPRFSAALVHAVERHVDVTLITSAKANVLNQLNRGTCDFILRRTGAPANLRIVLHPRMVHSKLMVIDDEWTDLGSANFTTLSHGVYDEVNVLIRDRRLAAQATRELETHVAAGEHATGRVPFRAAHYHLERAIVGYQSRATLAPRPPRLDLGVLLGAPRPAPVSLD